MNYKNLRDFIDQLEAVGQLKRIATPVSPHLEITEICDRTLRAGGPALLFENPVGHSVPLLANLFGTPERVALGMGVDSVKALREIGQLLAALKAPEPPKGMKDAWGKLPLLKQALNMSPKRVKQADCQQQQLTGDAIDLAKYPISMGPFLKFDPVEEVFPNSAEATALVTREYRDGFVCPTADKV